MANSSPVFAVIALRSILLTSLFFTVICRSFFSVAFQNVLDNSRFYGRLISRIIYAGKLHNVLCCSLGNRPERIFSYLRPLVVPYRFNVFYKLIINSSLILVNNRLFRGGMLCRVSVDCCALRL